MVGRCFIEAWSVTEEILAEFRMPFVARSGEYRVQYIQSVFEEGGKAEIVMEIEQVRRGYLQSRLEHCGARQVIIQSFPLNDAQNLAGKFLDRITQRALLPGMKSFVRGSTRIVPVPDTNGDDNRLIYEELKRLQMAQDGDEVSFSLPPYRLMHVSQDDC